MPIDVYCVLGSPPSRSVLLLGKAMGLEFNLIETSPITGATRTPEYHKVLGNFIGFLVPTRNARRCSHRSWLFPSDESPAYHSHYQRQWIRALRKVSGVKLGMVPLPMPKVIQIPLSFGSNGIHMFPPTTSRAILRYLFNTYGKEKDEHLYPKDPKARAIVDQRLDFDLGTLSAKAGACSVCIIKWNFKF